ncbi:MAG: dihydropteroate synthase, partial [Bacteroidetes bacterium]|nr:dihydropteroate synthase [Bacteroidota bacterium]
MGIINLTPDSFYAGSRKPMLTDALQQAEKMLNDGADFLDIGAYSSRPGAEDISIQEESDRLLPVVELVSANHPEAIISVDTFRS